MQDYCSGNASVKDWQGSKCPSHKTPTHLDNSYQISETTGYKQPYIARIVQKINIPQEWCDIIITLTLPW